MMSGVSTFYPHVLVCSFAIVLSVSAQAEEVKRDDVTGMIIADGWEDTRNNCITCHSANQFLRQKGTRQTWTEILEWMKTQGFREVGDETEKKILDYLAANYKPGEEYRRPPIPRLLMPKNPYESDISKALREKEAKTGKQ
jgi:hypothetical protein